jgi:hypothetical protein
MQDFWDTFKRPNLWTMGTEEGEEVQVKGIKNKKLHKSWENDGYSGTRGL